MVLSFSRKRCPLDCQNSAVFFAHLLDLDLHLAFLYHVKVCSLHPQFHQLCSSVRSLYHSGTLVKVSVSHSVLSFAPRSHSSPSLSSGSFLPHSGMFAELSVLPVPYSILSGAFLSSSSPSLSSASAHS